MCNESAPIATVGVACKVNLWSDDLGPLVGLNKRGGWLSGNWRLNQTMRRVGKVTPYSPPSRTLKPGWIGGPTNWICHVGGWNLQPSQGWKTHRNSPGRSGPPSPFQRSEAGSSWGKAILHSLPISASPRVCSFQMNCLIRMCDSSLFSYLWLMTKDYSIGWRDQTCQRTQISDPWWEVS